MRKPPRGHQQDDRGILLKAVDQGESDVAVFVLGESRGVFRAVAKGGRKSRRRFMGRLEPFTLGVFQTARYKGTDYLEAVDVRQRGDRISRRLGSYYLACYACEAALVHLEHGDPAREAFELLHALLTQMDEEEVDDRVARAAFEAGFLELQGLLPDLGVCHVCEARLGEDPLVFDTIRAEWSCEAHVGPPAPGRVTLGALEWQLFEEVRERGLPVLPLDPDRRPDLRAVNRLTALLFVHQFPRQLRSAALLNAHQAKEIQREESVGEKSTE